MSYDSFSGKYHRASQPSTGVLLLEMNRPPVNAFHDDMWRELQSIVERISASPDVRVVVLSSALDKGFTAGLDLTSTSNFANDGLDPARQALLLRQHVLDFQAAISSLEKCRQPIIAALFGVSLGLAIDIASACDIRLAASNAIFGIMEVDVGLAADIGTLQRLPKIIGNESKARELALTARKFGAEEAREMGCVSSVIKGGRKEVMDAAVDMATVIASKSPIAVISTKHLMNHARDHSIADGLEYTAAWNAAMLQSADLPIAMKAVMSKQTPSFPSLAGTRAKL